MSDDGISDKDYIKMGGVKGFYPPSDIINRTLSNITLKDCKNNGACRDALLLHSRKDELDEASFVQEVSKEYVFVSLQDIAQALLDSGYDLRPGMASGYDIDEVEHILECLAGKNKAPVPILESVAEVGGKIGFFTTKSRIEHVDLSGGGHKWRVHLAQARDPSMERG